jgi:predicted HTH transcriptional regulator
MHVLFEPQNDTVNFENDTVNLGNDTVNFVNDTVFSLIKQDKHITASEIGQRLNLSLATVKRKIKELKNNGELERVGSDKTGYWRTIE